MLSRPAFHKYLIFRVKIIKQNRERLIPVIECILLCGYQETPLRGSNDFGPINFKTSTHNEGNFWAILKYKTKDIESLKSHLESDTRNKYLSPQIQNEIINICGDILTKKLVDKDNKSQCFSVMADETTNVSVSEQFTICICHLSGTGSNIEINEDFLKFYEISSLTGNDLASAILNWLNSCGVDCDFLFGQGYDGAENMAGRFKGAQTTIRSKHPKVLYVHCTAHSLNLAVSSACNIPSIRNCLGIVEKYYCFFNFPKRNHELLEVINNGDWQPNVLFSFGLPLCKQLQKKNIDLREMISLANISIKVLDNLKENVDHEFKTMFKEAQRLAEMLDFEISVKRLANRQKHRSNSSSSDDPEDYYRVSICIPFIESFIYQLNERFLAHQNIFKGFQCLFDDTNSDHIDFETLLQIWKQKGKCVAVGSDEVITSNALDAIKHCDPIIFPNIFTLLKMLCTLPVSTATPERTFSSLKRVKTYLRNSMKEDCLNGLVLLSYYRNIEITPEEVLDELAKKKRKIDLIL
ncbi:hypothetical protein QTP88_000830 [Uroleucon formosanum]